MFDLNKLQPWEVAALVAGLIYVACQLPFLGSLVMDWRFWVLLAPVNALAGFTFMKCLWKMSRS